MPFVAQSGFPSAAAGESANSKEITETAPAANSTTAANFSTGTSRRSIQLQPLVTNTTAATPGTATDRGWHVLKAAMNRTDSPPARALIAAGAWTFTMRMENTQADVAGAVPTLTVVVYRRSAAGVYTSLFTTTSPTFDNTLAGQKTVTWSTAVQPDYVFETDETVHVEAWVNAQGVAVIGQVYRLHLGTITAVTFPRATGQAAGVASNYPRSYDTTTAPVVALGPWRINVFRAAVSAPVATAGRAITGVRTFATVTAPAAEFARRLTANRGLTTLAAASGQLRVGLPEEVLERFTAAGPADYSPNDAVKSVAGVVRDRDGTPVAGATVRLVRQSDDFVAATVTSAADGTYVFPRGSGDPHSYYVVVHTVDNRGGVTRRDRVPA